MAKIIGNTTATPNPRPDWLQNDENKADYIKNKPEVVVRTDIDNELNLESGNPVQNSTITQRFNELDESLKEYIDEQNSEQDENLGKLETLVTETMKATEINENSTDEQYPTAKAVYDMNQSTIEYIDNQNNTQDEEFTKLVTETVKTTTIDNSSTNDKYPTAKATYDFVKAETASMVDSAPETLDTLNELAAALGDDPNFATTVATQIGKKADKETFDEHINNKENPHKVTLTQLGVDATNTELNYIKGVKSDVQTQLDDKSPKSHTHNYNDLTNTPTSLPANGGNADTLDGKHASDFEVAGAANSALVDAKAYADLIKAEIENGESDNFSFDEEVVNSENSAIKVVPEGSGKYAAVNKVGGMSYKSRNLLEITATTQTRNGLTYTVNKEAGTITVVGTPDGGDSFDICGNMIRKLVVGKTYNFSGVWAVRINFSDSTVKYIQGNVTVTSDMISVIPYLHPSQDLGKVAINKTYYPMCVDTTQDRTFEPYYSGIRSAEVTSITATGKNLFNITTLTPRSLYQGGTVSFEGDKANISSNNQNWALCNSEVITVEIGKTYTFNCEITNYSATTSTYVTVKSENNNVYGTYYFTRNGGCKLVITPTENTLVISITSNGSGTSVTNTFTISNAQLEIGAEATEYEPYKLNTLSIPTGARGVGYGLGINENCYNYIDFERKVYVERCKTFRVTDTSGYTTIATANYSATSTCQQFNLDLSFSDGLAKSILFCDKLDCNGNVTGGKSAGCFLLNPSFLVLGIPKSWLTSYGYIEGTDSTYIASFKAWLTDNTLDFIYQLATPEETDISAYLQDDNFLEVAPGGTITAVNEYNYDAPTEISFFTSESPEKVIVADKIVGDLVGVAEEAQTLSGLESSITELNYLQGAKGNIQDQIDDLETKTPSIVVDGALNTTSTNPVQNKVVNAAINAKANASDLTSHTGNKNNPHGVSLSQLGVTATAAELNALDGITATTTELNYVDGVTSNIQTQLNNKASAGFHKTWSCATTVGSYSKLCRISGYSNFIMRIGLSQNNQVSYFTLLIGTGYASASVTCLGGSNFSANSNQIVRLTQQSAQVFDVEFYNTYGYNSATSVNVTCNILSPHSDINVTTYTAYTATSGTTTASCTCRPSGIVAPTFYGDLSGNADTATYGKRLYAPSIATTAGTTYTIDTYLTLIKNTLPLETQGYYTWKHSWSYAGNGLLSATIGSTTHKIQLAGAHCEFNGSSNGEYVLRITTATASGTSGASFTAGATYQYNYHGATYSPTWTIDNAIVGLSVNGKTITYTKNNGTTGTITTQDTNTTYSTATTSANGLMSSTDKSKLDGIASGANAYSHPAYTARTGVPTANATLSHGGTFTVTQPVCDATGHITALNTRTYTLPADNNTTYSAATQSAQGLMSAADKKKLDGIATGANAYTLPTASSSTLGGVKTTSTVTSNSGYTACPIISGVPYYKDTNTTYSLSSFGITATAAELNYCDGVTSNIQTQLNNLASDIDLNAMNIDGAYDNVVSLYTAYTGALNNLTAPGFYYVSNADATNYPVGTNGHVLVMANTGSTVHIRQVFWRAGTINSNSYQWYTRNKTADGWSAWWLLSGIETRYTGTLTSGTANVGSIYGGTSGWVIVAQVGANKRRSTLFIPRTFLNTDADKWCFTMSGDDYYFTFYFYYSGTTLYLKTNTSNPTTNAITHVYAIS